MKDPRCTPTCELDDPYPDHLCGRVIIDGVTTCSFCGNLDGSPECAAAGCWIPATQAHLDVLKLNAIYGF